jgi:hypothetical protein
MCSWCWGFRPQILESEVAESRRMGARSFPALVLRQEHGYWPVAVDYLDPKPMLETIHNILEN